MEAVTEFEQGQGLLHRYFSRLVSIFVVNSVNEDILLAENNVKKLA